MQNVPSFRSEQHLQIWERPLNLKPWIHAASQCCQFCDRRANGLTQKEATVGEGPSSHDRALALHAEGSICGSVSAGPGYAL